VAATKIKKIFPGKIAQNILTFIFFEKKKKLSNLINKTKHDKIP
jgi:hypothetical protein